MKISIRKAEAEHKKNGLAKQITPVFIDGIKWRGKSTSVFAYLGSPAVGGKKPAILLVHGGAGRAYDEWVKMWVQRGFVVLAPDLNAQMYGKEGDFTPNPAGGPAGYGSFTDDCTYLDDTWSVFCVQLLTACAEYLYSCSYVDSRKLFVHGISWGGYLTYLLLGKCRLFALAGVSYTTAFLYRDPYWIAEGLSEERMGSSYGKWVRYLDPKNSISDITTPLVWARGVNDPPFSTDLINDTLDLFAEGVVTPVFYREYAHNQEDGSRIAEIVTAIERAAGVKEMRPSGKPAFSIVYTCDAGSDARARVWHEEKISADEYLRLNKKEWAAWYYNTYGEDGLFRSTRIYNHGI